MKIYNTEIEEGEVQTLVNNWRNHPYIAYMFLIINDKINISSIKHNIVVWFQSEQDLWKRLGANGTFSEQNN